MKNRHDWSTMKATLANIGELPPHVWVLPRNVFLPFKWFNKQHLWNKLGTGFCTYITQCITFIEVFWSNTLLLNMYIYVLFHKGKYLSLFGQCNNVFGIQSYFVNWYRNCDFDLLVKGVGLVPETSRLPATWIDGRLKLIYLFILCVAMENNVIKFGH